MEVVVVTSSGEERGNCRKTSSGEQESSLHVADRENKAETGKDSVLCD